MHEIALNVQLEDIARAGVIAGHLSNLLPQPKDSVMGSTSLDTGITVPDKLHLQKLVDVVEEQVVHNPVPEKRRQDFPHLGVVDDEAFAWARLILPRKDGIPERNEIPLIVAFKAKLVLFTAFVTPCIFVCSEKV